MSAADAHDDQQTIEACARCAELEAVVLHAVRHGCRITTMAIENKRCACSALWWTAIVTIGEKVCAAGQGHTQDEAVIGALRTLGVVL